MQHWVLLSLLGQTRGAHPDAISGLTYFVSVSKTQSRAISRNTDFSKKQQAHIAAPFARRTLAGPVSAATLRKHRTCRVDQTPLQQVHAYGSIPWDPSNSELSFLSALNRKSPSAACRREPAAHSCGPARCRRAGIKIVGSVHRCKNAIAIQWVINNKIFLLCGHLHPIHPHESGTFLFQLQHSVSLIQRG